ncbi:hypothetical protein M427DRAFT_44875 [Gonapodya prolifera JEL478]|uniref:Uncharacterized protein n=1 Tax=Gonapodya prolifera (strain JEL478) TaxID=1344416 RepID=A0A139AD49_GONPJ|nr:hypothetical protein M427DRAFT_44875 [Gonapodya prolifera JEL478]|eukprot:KXS14678.1 hypothetical protein M427DRAFT_44875 [Gonapodya prolifera JEL478]
MSIPYSKKEIFLLTRSKAMVNSVLGISCSTLELMISVNNNCEDCLIVKISAIFFIKSSTMDPKDLIIADLQRKLRESEQRVLAAEQEAAQAKQEASEANQEAFEAKQEAFQAKQEASEAKEKAIKAENRADDVIAWNSLNVLRSKGFTNANTAIVYPIFYQNGEIRVKNAFENMCGYIQSDKGKQIDVRVEHGVIFV